MQLRAVHIFALMFLLIFRVADGYTQPTFTASFTPAAIGNNETTELRFKVINATKVESFTPPLLTNFIILGGPTPQSGIEAGQDGSIQHYDGITYQLKPKSAGTFTIGPALAKVDGKNLTSKSVRLSVVQQSGSRSTAFGMLSQLNELQNTTSLGDIVVKDGEDISAKITKNIFLKVDVSKTTCFVGEPILATYRLFTRLKSESNLVKNPSFNGFSVTDLVAGMNTNYIVEKLNGVEYNVYTLRRTQLYPLQAGVVTLESAIVNNTIRFVKEAYAGRIKQEEDVFGDISDHLPSEAFITEKITLETKPLIVNVKPLPEAGKPISFNGATGNYAIISAVQNKQISTDDAGSMRIILQGTGNFPLLNAPEFVWPSGIDGFEPKTRESINRFSIPVSGTKAFDYSFTVARAGKYIIPAIEYSYFDPNAGKYKIIHTDSISIDVTEGTGKKRPLPPEATFRESVSQTIFTNRWMIILPVALLILGGLFFWLRADHRNELHLAAKNKLAIKSQREADEQQFYQQNPLAETETMLLQNDSSRFYKSLNKALHLFLAHRLNIPADLLNRKTIMEALDKSGISVADSVAIEQLLDDIMLQLYTPHADEEDMRLFFERALRTIDIVRNHPINLR